jgi:hypothetical protein
VYAKKKHWVIPVLQMKVLSENGYDTAYISYYFLSWNHDSIIHAIVAQQLNSCEHFALSWVSLPGK